MGLFQKSFYSQFCLIRKTFLASLDPFFTPGEAYFNQNSLSSSKFQTNSKNGRLAERTLRVLQRLRPLHHLLPHSLLHFWQECRGSWWKLLYVRPGVSLWSSAGHLRCSAQTKTQGAQGHRWFSRGRRSGISLLSIMRGDSNGRRSEGGRSRSSDDGPRMIGGPSKRDDTIIILSKCNFTNTGKNERNFQLSLTGGNRHTWGQSGHRADMFLHVWDLFLPCVPIHPVSLDSPLLKIFTCGSSWQSLKIYNNSFILGICISVLQLIEMSSCLCSVFEKSVLTCKSCFRSTRHRRWVILFPSSCGFIRTFASVCFCVELI